MNELPSSNQSIIIMKPIIITNDIAKRFVKIINGHSDKTHLSVQDGEFGSTIEYFSVYNSYKIKGNATLQFNIGGISYSHRVYHAYIRDRRLVINLEEYNGKPCFNKLYIKIKQEELV